MSSTGKDKKIKPVVQALIKPIAVKASVVEKEDDETTSVVLEAGISYSALNLVIVGDKWLIDDFFDLLCGISLDDKHENVNSLLPKYVDSYTNISNANLKAFIKNKSRIPRSEFLKSPEFAKSHEGTNKDDKLVDILETFQTRLCGNYRRRDYSPYLNISEQRGPNDEEYILISRVKTFVMTNDSPFPEKEIAKLREEGLKKTEVYGVTIPINMDTYSVRFVSRNMYFTEEEHARIQSSKAKHTVENTSCKFTLVDMYEEGLDLDEQLNILLKDVESRKLFNYP
jgi:hypothetical protein